MLRTAQHQSDPCRRSPVRRRQHRPHLEPRTRWIGPVAEVVTRGGEVESQLFCVSEPGQQQKYPGPSGKEYRLESEVVGHTTTVPFCEPPSGPDPGPETRSGAIVAASRSTHRGTPQPAGHHDRHRTRRTRCQPSLVVAPPDPHAARHAPGRRARAPSSSHAPRSRRPRTSTRGYRSTGPRSTNSTLSSPPSSTPSVRRASPTSRRSSVSLPNSRSTPVVSASSPATTSRAPATWRSRSSAWVDSTREGFFRQSITGNRQRERYEAVDPVSVGAVDTGETVVVAVEGVDVVAKVWRQSVGATPLVLLDTAIDTNPGWAQKITDRLYSGDRRHRLQQELVLGVGGVRALARLGSGARRLPPQRRPRLLPALRTARRAGRRRQDARRGDHRGAVAVAVHHPYAGAGRHRPVRSPPRRAGAPGVGHPSRHRCRHAVRLGSAPERPSDETFNTATAARSSCARSHERRQPTPQRGEPPTVLQPASCGGRGGHHERGARPNLGEPGTAVAVRRVPRPRMGRRRRGGLGPDRRRAAHHVPVRTHRRPYPVGRSDRGAHRRHVRC